MFDLQKRREERITERAAAEQSKANVENEMAKRAHDIGKQAQTLITKIAGKDIEVSYEGTKIKIMRGGRQIEITPQADDSYVVYRQGGNGPLDTRPVTLDEHAAQNALLDWLEK